MDRELITGQMVDGWLDLAIDVNGIASGRIQTFVPADRREDPTTYNIGILLRPAARGRGYGAEALDAFTRWLREHAGDRCRLLALGDDVTDEDMFRSLAGEDESIVVGIERDRPTAARWRREHAGARRVEGRTDSRNHPMQRVFARLGWDQEGVVPDSGREWLLFVAPQSSGCADPRG